MITKTSTRLTLILGAFALGAAIGALTLNFDKVQTGNLAAIQTAAGGEPSDAAMPSGADGASVPAPSRPLFPRNKSDDAVTVIPDAPQANGVDGAPRILTTDLGFKVSPMCFDYFFAGEKKTGAIDVTTCEQVSGYKNIKTGLDQGRFRGLYEFPAEPDMPAETGYASYELLGDYGGGKAVQVFTETGGTGRFSTIAIVTLKGNMLSETDTLTGGDRCNGGITEAHIKDGKLSYTINATPGDFPVLAWGEDKGITPYEDLEASAMSCFGLATYTGGNLESVTFVPEALGNSGDWSSQYKLQKCFNERFKKQIDTGNKTLPLPEFKKFMDEFRANCPKT